MTRGELAIKKEADRIREKIKGGTIYGIPIDLDNPDHVIVAAYNQAISEELDKRLASINSWLEI